jgi:hypothetical protein
MIVLVKSLSLVAYTARAVPKHDDVCCRRASVEDYCAAASVSPLPISDPLN